MRINTIQMMLVTAWDGLNDGRRVMERCRKDAERRKGEGSMSGREGRMRGGENGIEMECKM